MSVAPSKRCGDGGDDGSGGKKRKTTHSEESTRAKQQLQQLKTNVTAALGDLGFNGPSSQLIGCVIEGGDVGDDDPLMICQPQDRLGQVLCSGLYEVNTLSVHCVQMLFTNGLLPFFR